MKHVLSLFAFALMSSVFSIAFGQTANHAVDFPGNQDGVRISDFQELDDLGSSVSFCSWYRVDEEALSVTNDGTYNPIVAKQYRQPQPVAPQTLLLAGYFYQGQRILSGHVGTDHGDYNISVGDVVVTDEWQHSCVTLSPGVLKLYLNGIVLDSVVTDPTAIINQNDDALEFGHRQDYPANNTYTWGGQIQEVGIWDDALSHSEVNEVMLCGPGSVSSELIGYWPLNENSGTQVNDLSGLNHHGEFLGNLDWFEVDSTLTCYPGCMDATACNFDPDATGDDGSCIPSGCLEPDACNFDPAAECEGEPCIYTCCPGPGCCDEGTAWSWESNTCVVVAPSDTDFDGCVGMTDLLDLLSVFGTCNETPWSCGDQLEYQGYDYATVQIGEQCWFAENMRSENYENGELIPANLGVGEWSQTSAGAVAVYGDEGSACDSFVPSGNACDANWSIDSFGRLYNWYTVVDSRKICPINWHVPDKDEWSSLAVFLGGDEVAGSMMKSSLGWFQGLNGSDPAGFGGAPGGYRDADEGFFFDAGYGGYFWSSSNTDGYPSSYILDAGLDALVNSTSFTAEYGFSIRCIQDSE